MKHLNLPLKKSNISALKQGETVSISGVIYTARDQAHKRICAALERGETPPINLNGAAIYYCGPTPAREGEVIGSCGPTTSARMDSYTPRLLSEGVNVLIGKGKRSEAVQSEIKKCGAVYFTLVGGAAALVKSKVLKSELVAYPDLGCEAIRALTVKNLEVYVDTV